jgi:hypothetical protein
MFVDWHALLEHASGVAERPERDVIKQYEVVVRRQRDARECRCDSSYRLSSWNHRAYG